jgi:thiamine biosynthesis lipoprotein
MTTVAPSTARIEFACFGSHAAASLAGEGDLEHALADVRQRLWVWHRRLTRFNRTSELCHLNADPRRRVPVSRLMCRFVAAALEAAELTGGLVDPTLVDDIEAAGYESDLGESFSLEAAVALAPARRPGGPNPEARWQEIEVDRRGRAVIRPPGVRLDSGGIAKGLCADIVGARLAGHDAYAVDCGGDMRIGGRARLPRTVRVADPFGGEPLHEFEVTDGGVATSGIGRRSWLDPQGRVAHHLLDPSTGRPAFTGIVQASALAPTAIDAEALAKAALLSGPEGAPGRLRHGGVLVFDDGSCEVIEPRGVAAR